MKLISVSYIDERRGVGSEEEAEGGGGEGGEGEEGEGEGELKIRSSVLSRRMNYLDKRYLLVLRSTSEGFKARI